MEVSKKYSSGGFFKLTIPGTLVQRIPQYAKTLAQEIQATKYDKRITIKDSTRRDEESMLRLVDFLDHGFLPPFDCTKPSSRLVTLELYDHAIELECALASDAVLTHIEKQTRGASLEAFLEFAQQVYMAKGKEGNPQHDPQSALGRMIKQQLVAFLPAIVEGGMAHVTKTAGVHLSKQLLEVMAENWGATGQRSNGAVG